MCCHAVQTQHPALVKKYEEMCNAEAEKRKRQRKQGSDDSSDSEPHMKQPRLDLQKITQKTVDDLVTDFIISSMQPFRVVEQESFIRLVESLSGGKRELDRRNVCARIKDLYAKMTTNLTDRLAHVDYSCTTADLWSCNNRSYLGVTVHWLEFVDGIPKRLSTALACRRMKGSHTFSHLAKALHGIHSKYNFTLDKIVSIVTDNAANFQKSICRVCH